MQPCTHIVILLVSFHYPWFNSRCCRSLAHSLSSIGGVAGRYTAYLSYYAPRRWQQLLVISRFQLTVLLLQIVELLQSVLSRPLIISAQQLTSAAASGFKILWLPLIMSETLSVSLSQQRDDHHCNCCSPARWQWLTWVNEGRHKVAIRLERELK